MRHAAKIVITALIALAGVALALWLISGPARAGGARPANGGDRAAKRRVRTAFLGRLSFLVVLIPLVLIGSKIVEVWAEVGGQGKTHASAVTKYVKVGENLPPDEEKRRRDKMESDWSFVDETGYGAVRRLDDAFFWALLALAAAVRGIWSERLDVDPNSEWQTLGYPGSRIGWGLLVMAGVVTLGLYGFGAWKASGTFFWWLRPESKAWPLALRWLVIALQFIEGVLTVLAIVASYLFALVGCAVGADLAQGWNQKSSVDDRAKLRRRARALIHSWIWPFVGANLFFAAYKFFVTDMGVTGYPSVSSPTAVLGLTSFMAIPFMFLVGYCGWIWPKELRAQIGLSPERLKLG